MKKGQHESCVYGLDWPINHADTKYLSRSPRPFLPLFFIYPPKRKAYMCAPKTLLMSVCFFYYGHWTYLYNVYVTYPLFFLKYSLYFNRSGDGSHGGGSGDGVSRYIEVLAFKFRYSFLPFLFIHFYILYSAAVLDRPNGLHLQKMDRRTVGNSRYTYITIADGTK